MPTYTKETALYDTGKIGTDINSAGQTASKYITAVDQNGIKVHAENNPTSNYSQIDANGMKVCKDSVQRAQFGETTVIGKPYDSTSTSNESRVAIDYHSLSLIDKENREYVFFSDLRDATGTATITESFVYDGSVWREFELGYTQKSGTTPTIKINNTTTTLGTITGTTLTIYTTATLNEGDIVSVTFQTTDRVAAFTLGSRSTEQGYTGIGGESLAIGTSNAPTGRGSFAQGINCKATGIASFASGESCIASKDHARAVGLQTTASGKGSSAEGYLTTASAFYTHAEGESTTASGSRSHAEGINTTASGFYSHAEGTSTQATNTAAHAEGDGVKASGKRSHAEGYNTTASGDSGAHAEGCSTTASGNYSHAEGNLTKARNEDSHAEGYNTSAYAAHSHAEGYSTAANGWASHAEGESTKATGSDSHAEGFLATASGDFSHAEGRETTASGGRAHAEGYYTFASGDYSHAQNCGTVATEAYQTVIGKYNSATIAGTGTSSDPYVYSDAGNYAFIIGNGKYTTTGQVRSNALTVDWNGEMALYLEVDSSASSSTAATSGEDMDLFNAIRSLGWYSDVIS